MNDLPQCVAIVSNSDESLFRFHNPIMKRLVDSGLRVYAVSPPGAYVKDIEGLGVDFVPWVLSRRSLNPLTELASLIRLVRIYQRLRPELAQHFTVKPNVYGAIAARLAGVPVVFSGVQGLGYAFGQGGGVRAALRLMLSALYKLTALLSDRFVLLNSHDLDRLFSEKSMFRYKAMVVTGGTGVNLQEFNSGTVSNEDQLAMRESLGIQRNASVVTMASRLLYDKGVVEYVKAANTVRRKMPYVTFVLAGSPDPDNPASVSHDDLREWVASGDVLIAGHVTDMPTLLALSDLVVLPSYSEGIPRVLIEAAAMARPIVSTTIPGVAEIVEDGVNGLLVPPRDADALGRAIEELLDNPDLRAEYGKAGRVKAEREYDDREVAQRYVEEYRKAWAKARSG